MDKKEALTRLNSLEHEAKELRKIIEKADEPKPITERVKTFSDACRELGINPNSVVNGLDTKDEVAFKKLKIIARALNEGWTPNWKDPNQPKYYPYFKYENGFLSLYYWSYGSICHYVPAALYFKSKELALYAGQQFNNEYNEYLNNI